MLVSIEEVNKPEEETGKSQWRWGRWPPGCTEGVTLEQRSEGGEGGSLKDPGEKVTRQRNQQVPGPRWGQATAGAGRRREKGGGAVGSQVTEGLTPHTRQVLYH